MQLIYALHHHGYKKRPKTAVFTVERHAKWPLLNPYSASTRKRPRAFLASRHARSGAGGRPTKSVIIEPQAEGCDILWTNF